VSFYICIFICIIYIIILCPSNFFLVSRFFLILLIRLFLFSIVAVDPKMSVTFSFYISNTTFRWRRIYTSGYILEVHIEIVARRWQSRKSRRRHFRRKSTLFYSFTSWNVLTGVLLNVRLLLLYLFILVSATLKCCFYGFYKKYNLYSYLFVLSYIFTHHKLLFNLSINYNGC